MWGSGPVAYLVHGWGGNGSQLAAFVRPLLAEGFRVVLFDAPAHGDSEPGPAGPGRTHGVEFGKALDAVFAKFGPAEAVIAHSLGAISTYLTLRFGWLLHAAASSCWRRWWRPSRCSTSSSGRCGFGAPDPAGVRPAPG